MRAMTTILAATAALALAFGGLRAQTTEAGIHDPVMIRSDGTYYLFGTGQGVEMLRSDDAEVWEEVGRVHQETPEWVFSVLPGFGGGMWAPDIIEHDGTFYLYYAVSAFGRNNSAIGVATNTTLDPDDPEYEWTDHGMLIQSVPGKDMWNAIDAHAIIDRQGQPWLSFGSHWGGIKLVKLDDSLTGLAEPQEWHSISARHRYWKLDERDAGDSANPELDYETLYPDEILELNRASENGAIEAPVIFWKDGYYYQFVSWDRCCRGVESTYKVVVGRSPDITGPYLDKENEPMEWGGGSMVVFGFGDDQRFAAGGHNDVVTFDGTDYIVLHAYDNNDDGRSKLVMQEIMWDPYGWPYVYLEGSY